jgi:glucose/arabinose dehydrogenase
VNRPAVAPLLAIVTGLTPSAATPPVAAAILPADFSDSLVASIGSPTALAFAPGGRLFVTTQPGLVRLIKDDVLQPGSALDITARTCSNSERGLLGIAVEPGVAVNPRVFLYP